MAVYFPFVCAPFELNETRVVHAVSPDLDADLRREMREEMEFLKWLICLQSFYVYCVS